MKIEIKLADPKSCNGCPIMQVDGVLIDEMLCGYGYKIKTLIRKAGKQLGELNKVQHYRPQECIDKHGE